MTQTSPCSFLLDEDLSTLNTGRVLLPALAKNILSKQESALNRSDLEQVSDFRPGKNTRGEIP